MLLVGYEKFINDLTYIVQQSITLMVRFLTNNNKI
jgi:hypothetical protein